MDNHSIPGTNVVMMPHGASWTPEAGFQRCEGASSFDFFKEVRKLASKHQETLREIYAAEDRIQLSYDEFCVFFRKFCAYNCSVIVTRNGIS